MRPLPTPPSPGKPVSATLIRQLIDAIRERTVFGGMNIRARHTRNGTFIDGIYEKTKRGQDARTFLPWDFFCEEDPDTHERTGGWFNCSLQIGYFHSLSSPDIFAGHDETNIITGTDQTEDGNYAVVIDAADKEAEIQIIEGTRGYIDGDTVAVYIGSVQNGVLVGAPHVNPFIYTFE